MKLLLIDNYDSFTYNLAHQLNRVLNCDVNIVYYDKLNQIDLNYFDAFVISPGPKSPIYYNYNFIFNLGKPVLGICLGMQIMNIAFGGKLKKLNKPVHGITKEIMFEQKIFNVAVYNSLICHIIADSFDLIAYDNEKNAMSIKHSNLPLIGYQFHPESFMTEKGDYFIRYAFDYFKKY